MDKSVDIRVALKLWRQRAGSSILGGADTFILADALGDALRRRTR
jgi:hypothetical protein